MSSIFDRLRTELDQIGDRVKDAVESSKLHLERSSLIGSRSKAAYKLGMLVYKKERGTEVDQAQIDTLMARMDDIAAKITKIDRQIDELDDEDEVRVEEEPTPPPPNPSPADAQTTPGN